MIHPTAIVESGARLAANVSVGAYSLIGPRVELGEGSVIGPHVVIEGRTRIGRNNRCERRLCEVVGSKTIVTAIGGPERRAPMSRSVPAMLVPATCRVPVPTFRVSARARL